MPSARAARAIRLYGGRRSERDFNATDAAPHKGLRHPLGLLAIV
jgi:hypothetical protein